MDESRAFDVLGVSPLATEAEISSRFRELSSDAHPDAGGSEEQMKLLTQAYHVALASVRSRAVVPVTLVAQIMESMRVSQELAAKYQEELVEHERDERFTRKSRQALDYIIQLHTSHLRHTRQLATLMTAIAVGIGALTSKALPIMTELQLSPFSPQMTSLLLLFGLVCGFMAWMMNYRADLLEARVRDLGEALDDKSTYVGVLEQILPITEGRPLTRGNLISSIQTWVDAHGNPHFLLPSLSPHEQRYSTDNRFISTVRQIGPADFSHLLVIKGLAHGLIRERVVSSQIGASVVYEVVSPDGEPQTD